MRKILFLLIFSGARILNAQPVTETTVKHFGFQAGIQISNMNFNLGSTAPDTTIAASWKVGFNFGFILSVPLSEKFTLQPEYSFARRYGTDNSVGIDYRLDYLSMPVLVKYQISDQFALVAGPQLELLINAQSTENGEDADITHDVEERSIGIVGGLEFNVNETFFLTARYMQGLNHIGIYQRTNVKEFKYELASFTAGFRF
jgi:hypothetical protein